MKDFRFLILLMLLIFGAAQASDSDATFKRVNSVALSEFPPGTTSYDLYWIDGKDQEKKHKNACHIARSGKDPKSKVGCCF